MCQSERAENRLEQPRFQGNQQKKSLLDLSQSILYQGTIKILKQDDKKASI